MGIVIKHSAERLAFEGAFDAAVHRLDRDPNEGYLKIIDLIQRVLGDAWPDYAYDNLREAFSGDGKWKKIVVYCLKS